MNDHRDFMVDLARRNGWTRGVELGLGQGRLFRRLLQEVPGLFMVGVDLGARAERREQQLSIAAQHPGRCIVHSMTTEAAAEYVDDGWADFVFIDAAHSYGATAKDIRAWESKVRPGGWFGGHDYHPSHPGVIKAVSELMADRFEVLDFWIWARA